MSAGLRTWRAHLLAVAVVAGLSASLLAQPPDVAAVLAVAAIAASALGPPRARFVLVALGLALAACWWGGGRVETLGQSILRDEIGAAGDAVLVVTAPPRRSEYEVRVQSRVRSFRGRPVDEAVQLELPPGRAPPQGAVVEAFAQLALPDREAGFDERTWLARRGVHVVARARDWRVVGARGGIGALGDRLRGAAERGVASVVGGERRAVLAGIVLGADEGLTPGLRDAFRASGLYHLLAVSGQNIAFLAFGVLLFARLVALPRLAAQLLLLAVICAYVLAVGWQPSVVRAGIAGGLAALAFATARERDRWWLLLVGAIVLLGWNPYALLDPGFQLSFGAVAAIFLALPRVLAWLEGFPMPGTVRLAVALSGVCAAATAPILWFHFGVVPVFSVLANVLAAPVAGLLLGLALVAALLAPVVPPAALALAWVDGWLAAYLIACAKAVAALPHAQVGGRGLLAGLGLAGVVWVIARLRPPRGLRAVALLATSSLVLVAWSVGRGEDPRPPPAGLRVTFLDVGQGDGVLVEAPGVSLLVDQGPPEAGVARQLRRLGVRRLTALVLTHPQRDHVGGAADVVRALAVGFVLDPLLATSGPERDDAVAEARERRVRVLAARAGLRFRLGPLRVAVLWPDGPGFPAEDPNDRAIVLLVSYRAVDLLLTADAESNVTAPLDLPPVEILKVAHHGSADAGLPQLLERTRPQVAVISVGRGNPYGHPAPSTLQALRAARGLDVYRTDLDGRVVVESDGERLWVDEER